MHVLALILARGGSKRLPGKNLRLLNGKPLIVWTIDAARDSGVFDRIVVSTDDPKTAEVGKAAGVSAPFLRPEEFATDAATSEDAMIHAIEWLKREEHYSPDWVMLLQPTSPLRAAKDIVAAIDLAQSKNADAVVACTEDHPCPFVLIPDGEDDEGPVRREKNAKDTEHLHVNGAIYLVRTEILLRDKTLYPPKLYAYRMPKKRSMDIDTEEEWKMAERSMGV